MKMRCLAQAHPELQMTWRWTWMRHSKRVASEKVNERRWINVIESYTPDIERGSFGVVNHAVFSGLVVCRISVRLLYHILFYYSVRVKIHSELCGLYGHNTTSAIRQLQPDRHHHDCPKFFRGCHNAEPAIFKMDQSVSFSTGGVAMGARPQLLGDLLPTVGYTSYRHSTMKSL